MQYAINHLLDRVEASPNTKAVCPCCESPVVAKCGNIVVNHWSHKSLSDCDSWWEPEGKWHRYWKKMLAPPCAQEVVLGKHRADLVGKVGVVELQHSPISVSDIIAREYHYGDGMIWLFDAQHLKHTLNVNQLSSDVVHIRHHQKSILQCSRPVFLDFGGFNIYRVTRMGKTMAAERTEFDDFVNQYCSGNNDPKWREFVDFNLSNINKFKETVGGKVDKMLASNDKMLASNDEYIQGKLKHTKDKLDKSIEDNNRMLLANQRLLGKVAIEEQRLTRMTDKVRHIVNVLHQSDRMTPLATIEELIRKASDLHTQNEILQEMIDKQPEW